MIKQFFKGVFMTKQDIQKRILQNDEILDLSKFSWDEKTKSFSSNENNLVLDFNSINDVTFKTGDYCTFYTGDECTFKTGYECIFKTGNWCIFDTGYSCTFKTGYNCIFNTGNRCIFDTGGWCIFNYY
jgi:hypothetical protein